MRYESVVSLQRCPGCGAAIPVVEFPAAGQQAVGCETCGWYFRASGEWIQVSAWLDDVHQRME